MCDRLSTKPESLKPGDYPLYCYAFSLPNISLPLIWARCFLRICLISLASMKFIAATTNNFPQLLKNISLTHVAKISQTRYKHVNIQLVSWYGTCNHKKIRTLVSVVSFVAFLFCVLPLSSSPFFSCATWTPLVLLLFHVFNFALKPATCVMKDRPFLW